MNNPPITIRKTTKLYICPYADDIFSMKTGEAALFLKKKGLKIWQIARSLNIERSTVYFHINPLKKKENSIQRSYERIIKIKPEFKALPFENFCDMIQTNGKYVCFYSGKEIDLAKNKWAINVRDFVAYIYLKEYSALEGMSGELEKICERFLKHEGYKIEKINRAF
jgi:predicted transcriptional regulator